MKPAGAVTFAVLGALAALASTGPAGVAWASPGAVSAPTEAPRGQIDRTAVRFYAPETGGTVRPRFVSERTLAFEARLAALAERTEGVGEGYDERHVRAALEHHVVEEILAGLAHKLIVESSAASRPDEADIARVGDDLSAALLERLGGRARVEAAARAEGLDGSDVDAILQRQALAAWYLDRAVTPLLKPTDEQLREVFRTSAHPYRGQPFESVRASLRRWFVLERVRLAETSFLQAARARVRIIVTP